MVLYPETDSYDRLGLEFDWKIDEFSLDKMKISLNFETPLEISKLGKRKLDRLSVTVKNDTDNFFRAQRSTNETLITFKEDSNVNAPVPTQLTGST